MSVKSAERCSAQEDPCSFTSLVNMKENLLSVTCVGETINGMRLYGDTNKINISSICEEKKMVLTVNMSHGDSNKINISSTCE